jgi:hypothetical protein
MGGWGGRRGARHRCGAVRADTTSSLKILLQAGTTFLYLEELDCLVFIDELEVGLKGFVVGQFYLPSMLSYEKVVGLELLEVVVEGLSGVQRIEHPLDASGSEEAPRVSAVGEVGHVLISEPIDSIVFPM